ncbi:MAG: nucleotidyl transferase AbiEii/AbiGii toxin family protein [Kiritimatiellia bacterium]
MKDYLRQLTEGNTNALARNCLAREYLQARVLESLQDTGAFMRWAFVGGTALRFLFSIPRFSEDLDFSLIQEGLEPAFKQAMEEVRRAFTLEGYRVDITVNERKTVASAWVRFPGLLYELGLSAQATQVLSIKLKLDTRPPPGACIETSIVRRHATLNLCHYDKASLFAGKLHAVLSRKWTKGRDLYDLAWYLADRRWPEPNLDQLNAALSQTGWAGPTMTATNWRSELARRLATLDWQRAQADVRPFLERERDIDLVTLESLNKLLETP